MMNGNGHTVQRVVDLERQVKEIAAQDVAGVMPVANVRTMFGARGDGSTDDTSAIQAAVDQVEAWGRGVVFLPQGQYVVDSTDGAVVMRDASDVAVIGNNAKILCNAYTLNDSNTGNVRLVQFTRCSNVVVTGLHILLQIDYSSAFTNPVNRVDEALSFYADTNVTSNVSIFGNIFEFDGPNLDDEGSGFNSRLTMLRVVGNQSTAARTARNFKVYDNTFLNCAGRGIYFAWARQIAIWGNIFREFGKYDDATNTGSQSATAYRVLGCKDADVQVGIVNCYSGSIAGSPPDENVLGVRVGKGDGSIGDTSKNIVVHDGVINLNNCPGDGLHIADGPSENFLFHDILVNGNEDYAGNGGGGTQRGLRLWENTQSNGTIQYIRFRGITLRDLDVYYSTPSGDAATYNDVLLEDIQEIDGTNLTSRYTDDAPKLYRRRPADEILIPNLRVATRGSAGDESGNLISDEGFSKSFTANGTLSFNVDERMPYVDYATGAYHALGDAAFNRITSAMTVGCWVYFDAAAGTTEYITGRVRIGTEISWYIRRNSGGKLRFSVTNDGSTETAIDSDQTPAQATWVHVVGRYNPSTHVVIFVDGVKTENTTSIPASSHAGTSDLAIGAQSNGGAGMDGRVARWWMVDRSLDDDFIIDLGQRERSLLFGT